MHKMKEFPCFQTQNMSQNFVKTTFQCTAEDPIGPSNDLADPSSYTLYTVSILQIGRK